MSRIREIIQIQRRGLLLGIAVFFLCGCTRFSAKKEPISKSDFLLNTFVTITIYDGGDSRLLEESLELCREYEEKLSKTIETSEIYQLNHREKGSSFAEVSETTADLIEKGLTYSRISRGAFDITIEPLTSLWNFTGNQKQVPEAKEIAAAAKRVNYQHVSVEGNQIYFDSPETSIDLGAIAKGYIADRVKEYLVDNGVKSAIIDLGGNVLCIGSRMDGTPFRIGLQMPFKDRSETIAVLMIRDRSVVTSGVYERCFTEDGINYHHLLNPKTGYPYQNGLLSVTIVSKESVDGDGLSTTCFSMGLEKGLELINSMEGVYGYFITDDYQVHYSQGAADLLNQE